MGLLNVMYNFKRPFQDAHCRVFVVLNRLLLRNKMMFENILDVLYFCSGHLYTCMKEMKNKIIFLIFKHFAQRSHLEACRLNTCSLFYNYFVFKSLL